MDPHGLLKSRHLTITFKILCIPTMPAFQTSLMPSSALHSRKLTCFPFLTHARLLSASPALGPLNCYSFSQQCYSLVFTSPSYPLSHHLICLFHSIQQNLKLFYMCIFLFVVSFSTRMSLYKGFVMFYFISSLPKSTPRAE